METLQNTSKIIKVKIGNILFDCILPISQEEGLNKISRENLKDKGMLFSFPSRDITLISYEMTYPIKVIIIDNYEVIAITELLQDNKLEAVGTFAIELLNDNKILNKISVGDKVKIKYNMNTLTVKTKDSRKKYSIGGSNLAQDMFLLDKDGNVQMIMEGKERIFSREDTKQIMSFLNKKPSEDNLIELGKLIASIIEKHSNQKQEYVKE